MLEQVGIRLVITQLKLTKVTEYFDNIAPKICDFVSEKRFFCNLPKKVNLVIKIALKAN